ncbi:MAG TPA: hypothetical protein VMH22_13490 [bacterium]|nr:hypothetical protein [bacterium]
MHTRFVRLVCAALTVSLLLVVSGCVSTAVRFVVVTDVPPSPSFTVVPGSTSPDDAASADAITEDLVALGVRVLARPALVKQRTEYSGQSSGTGVGVTLSGNLAVGGTGGEQSGNVITSVDPIALIQETQADYVVFTKTGPWLDIVKRKDGQIVFAGNLVVPQDNGVNCCLSPGFWVRKTPATQRERLGGVLRQMGVIAK